MLLEVCTLMTFPIFFMATEPTGLTPVLNKQNYSVHLPATYLPSLVQQNWVPNQKLFGRTTSLDRRFLLIPRTILIVACRNRIIWQSNPYFLLSAAYLMCFFRTFSSFDVGKQGSSIAKNKVPLVTMLMLSNQGESKLPSTTFTLTIYYHMNLHLCTAN